jgi:RimJ/RimL family protein N-acetyltransferase
VLVRLGQEVQEVPRRLTPPAPPLSDGVVRLEPLDDGRFVPEFEALTLDLDVRRFTRVPEERGGGWVAQWLGGYASAWTDDASRAGFAVVEARDGTFLGMAALVAIDWDGQQAELGYVVAPAARGRGIAGRSIALVSRWAFERLGLERLEAVIDVENDPSLRFAERAGWTYEGVRRSVYFKDGLRRDMAVYSLLSGARGGGDPE